ncbi:MFS transporter [Rhodococcus sp. HM1]|uniref:MFS transporter n=1 Tax=unclassified Rhodococcus (in: high G+C Gram-positive bacteria) TaxID=192944 RepID=UPI001E2D2414|nr:MULTISPECIES: MFS transporter [unclassified Rhodococcus (in: high G+C Gram-positive bacteria)]MCK8669535.1 MFS transporter [Rhodococcus sp. HM1]
MSDPSLRLPTGPIDGSAVSRSTALIITALVLAECLSAFEAGMIFIALPRFSEIFEAPASTTGWAVTAYMLVAATAALVGGRLGDMYGRKKVLILVMLVSTLGSVISVFGDSMGAIIVGRGVQGAAGAILPLCYGIAREALPAGKVSLAVGFISGAALLAGSGGSLIAGLLLDVADWHMIFVFAAVLAVVASIVAAFALPGSHTPAELPRFDYIGAALLTPGLTALLFGITQGPKWGWTSIGVVGLIVIGIGVLAVWTVWEMRRREPLVDLRVLTNRQMSLNLIGLSVLALGPVGAVQIVTPMILQSPTSLPVGLGMSATVTGLVAGIGAIVGFGASPIAGVVAGRWGGRTAFFIGAVLFAVANLMIYFGHKSLPVMMGVFAVAAVATAFAYTGYPKIVIESVPEEVTSVTTGVLSTARQAFSAVGVAIVSVMLSLWTVPGTTAPALSAFDLAVGWFIACSLVVAVVCLFIARPEQTGGAEETAPENAEPSATSA